MRLYTVNGQLFTRSELLRYRFGPVAWLMMGGIAGGMALSSMNKPKMPTNNPIQPSVTALSVAQKSEMDKQNKRIADALLMKDFTKQPKLNPTGLLGW